MNSMLYVMKVEEFVQSLKSSLGGFEWKGTELHKS